MYGRKDMHNNASLTNTSAMWTMYWHIRGNQQTAPKEEACILTAFLRHFVCVLCTTTPNVNGFHFTLTARSLSYVYAFFFLCSFGLLFCKKKNRRAEDWRNKNLRIKKWDKRERACGLTIYHDTVLFMLSTLLCVCVRSFFLFYFIIYSRSCAWLARQHTHTHQIYVQWLQTRARRSRRSLEKSSASLAPLFVYPANKQINDSSFRI